MEVVSFGFLEKNAENHFLLKDKVDLDKNTSLNIDDIKFELNFYELLDTVPEERHYIVSGQIRLLMLYCLKYNIKQETLMPELFACYLQIIKELELPIIVDFEKLLQIFNKSKSSIHDKYNSSLYDLYLSSELISEVCDLYLNFNTSSVIRTVLIEKEWKYHIGCKTYWNKKILKHAQEINI